MSRRWLVTLALAVVALPQGAAGARVEHGPRTVTTSRGLTAPAGPVAPAALPAGMVERLRQRLGASALHWLVAAEGQLVAGFAVRPGGGADHVVALAAERDARASWRRTIDSIAAVALGGGLLAVERAGALDVLDAGTGRTLATTPLVGQGILSVARASERDLHIKTAADLIAIDRRTGDIRWVQAASARGNIALVGGAVVDSWVDRLTHRYGIVTYDPRDGRQLASVDLGSTGGWYDAERVELAPDGAGEVMVSAMFATS